MMTDIFNEIFNCCRRKPMVSRPLQDPGISLDPGIFSKSQSRDSQKSDPRIFWDFQKPLNDCILRLLTPFIGHNNLLWDLWLLQECPNHFLNFWFFSNQYSRWTNSHWFSDARRSQSINQIFTSHLIQKPTIS